MKTQLSTFDRLIHLMRTPYFFIFWLSLIVISYFFIDKPLAYFFEQSHRTLFFYAADYLTMLGKGSTHLIVLSTILLASLFLIKNPHFTHRCSFVLFCFLTSALINYFLKVTLGRARPTLLFSEDIYGFMFFKIQAAYNAFPSGHAITIASVMFALCYLFPRYWWAWLSTMLLIASTRVILNAHYLSDVLASIYLAAMIVSTLAIVWEGKIIPRITGKNSALRVN